MNTTRDTLNVTASFVIGAAVVFALDRAAQRWRASRSASQELGLRARVQARIDELVSHPQAVHFQFEGNLLRVSGHVLATEVDGLLSQLTQLRGVHRVHNALSPVQDAKRLKELSRGLAPEPQAT